MMKCSACGKEVGEGFAYCPSCGSKATTAEEATSAKRLAAEENMSKICSKDWRSVSVPNG